MTFIDPLQADGLDWIRVREEYEVTRKPRGVGRGDESSVPFAAMEDIPQGGSYGARFRLRRAEQISSGTYFEKDDLLVARITPSFENGKQAIAFDLPGEFGYASTEIIPLRPRRPDHDRRFLFFYLLHPDVRAHVAERMEGSTGRQRVPPDVILDLPMPRVEPQEQRAMADVLETIQRAQTLAVHTAGRVGNLRRAAMRELFTRGLRGEAQKETEIGPIPMSWDLTPFASIREWLQYGTSTRCTYGRTDTPVLRIPNVHLGRIISGDLKYCDIDPEEAETYRLEIGDLLFVRTNGVLERLGACAVYEGEPANALFASYLIRGRLNRERVDPRFAAYFLGSDAGLAIVAGRATPAADGKYNLNTGTIDGLPIPLPTSLDEQREIVQILDAIDRKIDLHRRKAETLDQLFKALLHKLMTGEIRVADLDLSALTKAPG